MSNPRIYAFCDAGSKWETVHKSDIVNLIETVMSASVKYIGVTDSELLELSISGKTPFSPLITQTNFPEDGRYEVTIRVGSKDVVFKGSINRVSGNTDILESEVVTSGVAEGHIDINKYYLYVEHYVSGSNIYAKLSINMLSTTTSDSSSNVTTNKYTASGTIKEINRIVIQNLADPFWDGTYTESDI